MSGGSKTGAAAGWVDAAGVLRERARVTWALAEALEAACGGARAEDAVGVVEAIVARAVGDAAPRGSALAPRKVAGAGRSTEAGGAAAEAWRELQRVDLAGSQMPAVWFASGGTGGNQATVALGLGPDGGKQLLGVWAGGGGEHRCSQQVASELFGRGLSRGATWLAVTEGQRALDLALRQQWGPRVVMAHCQDRVAAAVTGHLPERLRAGAAGALRRAWDGPDVRRELEALAASWQHDHPGAAARLLGECEATAATAALGLRGALARRLRAVAPARYLLSCCVPGARGRSGQDWVAAVALQALRRQAGFRRVPERAALGDLLRALGEWQAVRPAG